MAHQVGDFFEDVGGQVFGRNPGAQAVSRPEVLPSVLSEQDIATTIGRLMNLTGRAPQSFNRVQTGVEASPFFSPFRSALTDRLTLTAPERQLIEDIQGQTSAQFARRGLGESPVAASRVATSIAPTLVALRQQRINNLGRALGQSLQGQQLGVSQRGQDIQSALGQFASRLQGLLSTLEFGRPQPVGQVSRGAQPNLLDTVGGFVRNVGSVLPGSGAGGSISGA